MRTLENAHPGEILSSEFLKPLNLMPSDLAQTAGIEQSDVEQIIAGTQNITPDTALCLSRCLDVTPQFWLNLQTMYDSEQEASA